MPKRPVDTHPDEEADDPEGQRPLTRVRSSKGRRRAAAATSSTSAAGC